MQDREADASYRAPRANFTMSDFDIVGRLGDGSFSTVILGRHRGDSKQYAIKIVNKHLVVRNRMVEYVRSERNILDKLDHDGIVKLLFTFQDQDSLYFGCEFCSGGDLYEQIHKRQKLGLSDTQFYAAEIVDILEYLRSSQVVHRDLKPENLLLTESGHLKLTDFGSAKAFFLPPIGGTGKQARTTSFVGTAEYVSPEVLSNQPLSYPADLWALGCVIFQMLAGTPPFKAPSEYLTFQKVSEKEYEFPDDFPPLARDLVDKLLAVDPSERLGAEDLTALKEHPFFKGVEWTTLRQQKAPSFIPPKGPTPEQEGLDWELTSMVREHMDLERDLRPSTSIQPAQAAVPHSNQPPTVMQPLQPTPAPCSSSAPVLTQYLPQGADSEQHACQPVTGASLGQGEGSRGHLPKLPGGMEEGSKEGTEIGEEGVRGQAGVAGNQGGGLGPDGLLDKGEGMGHLGRGGGEEFEYEDMGEGGGIVYERNRGADESESEEEEEREGT